MKNRSYAIQWVAFAILLLGGLYMGLQIPLKVDDASGPQSVAHRLFISSPDAGAVLPVFTITQGDIFTLAIQSDRPGELDVHGYERGIDVKPHGEVRLTLLAENAGVFPLHLHEPLDPQRPDGPVSHRHLAMLHVKPK